MPPAHIKRLIKTLPEALVIIQMLEQELTAQMERINAGEKHLQLLLQKYKKAAERLRSSPFRTLEDKIYREDHLFVDFYETVEMIQNSFKPPVAKEHLATTPVPL
jgi:hypothetical protein